MSDSITISRIELQNGRTKTYALYNKDIFLTEITEDTLVHFTISRGSSFSRKEFNRIIEHDKVNLCLQQAYNYLQRRPHLAKELQRKLRNKQINPDIIAKAFHHLQKNNYINDKEYIRMFIRDALRQAKSGPLLIKKKLAEKGAVFFEIEQELDELFPITKQTEVALSLLNLKNQKLTEESFLKRKQKLQSFGMNRGFSWNVLEQVINQVIQAED
jgi:regulatory protein